MTDNILSNNKSIVAKTVVAIILILVLGLIAIVSILRDRIVNYQQNQVAIIGQGRVYYSPDLATINLGVQIDKAPKAEEALNQLNTKIKNIVAAIKMQGIAPEDIVTQNYSLYPQYDYKDNVSIVSGYNANQQISVKVRDLKNNPEKINKILVEASKAGVNQVLGINFDVSNLEELKQEAKLKAIADAKSKAEKLANAVGVKLGKIVGWWENVIQAPGIPNSIGFYGGDGKGGMGGSYTPPTLPSGIQEIIIEMSVSYQLK